MPCQRCFSVAPSEPNLELVKKLGLALEDHPHVAEKISQSIDVATARRMSRVLEGHASDEPLTPTFQQLKMAMLVASLPYFGFGVLDNAIMIMLGEVIDATLCVKFGFSTMMAAALGNTFSDAIGVYSGGMVEDLAQKHGIEAPRMSRAQALMPITKVFLRLGQTLGIIAGCIVGMFPLLFSLDSEILKTEKALDDMFETVVDEVAKLLHCEAAMLLFVDYEKNEIYPRSSSNPVLDHFRIKLGTGTSGTVAETGQFLNIDDIRSSDHYIPSRHDNYFGSGIRVNSLLVFPIFGIDPSDKKDKVLGVLQVINKEGGDGFNDKDEDVLAALCSHISTSLAAAYGVSGGFRHTLANCKRSLNLHGSRMNVAEERRAQIAYEEVMTYCTDAVGASATQLLVSDSSLQTDDLILKVSDRVPAFRAKSVDLPVVGKCRDTGLTMCVNNLQDSTYCAADTPDIYDNYKGTGINVRAILAAPCISTDGEVLAVLACLKGDKEENQSFTPADVHFLNSVARYLALNLQGSGAALQQALKQTKGEHVQEVAEVGIMQEDRNKEVRNIVSSVINLLHKGGGQVDQADIRLQLEGASQDPTLPRTT